MLHSGGAPFSIGFRGVASSEERGERVDRLSHERRSALMSRIRGKDTLPERTLRRLLHSFGYRYRLHGRDLPGCPDIVFRKRRKVIFVHGCFWHLHAHCKLGALPKSRLRYWKPKLEANVERDKRNIRRLRSKGWKVLVVWQCQLRDLGQKDIAKIQHFLEK